MNRAHQLRSSPLFIMELRSRGSALRGLAYSDQPFGFRSPLFDHRRASSSIHIIIFFIISETPNPIILLRYIEFSRWCGERKSGRFQPGPLKWKSQEMMKEKTMQASRKLTRRCPRHQLPLSAAAAGCDSPLDSFPFSAVSAAVTFLASDPQISHVLYNKIDNRDLEIRY